MIALLLAVASLPDWVPARWMSADPASLELLAQTPVNCLLLEPEHWSAALVEQAKKRGIATLGVIRPGAEAAALTRRAVESQLTGVVFEGEFAPEVVREAATGTSVVEMLPRRGFRPGAAGAVNATNQGVWPGIPMEANGSAKAGPTGSPWVSTNTGFLLFARAAGDGPVWIANRPPPGQVLKVENYLQAICDAAVLGARWVVALDADFSKRLLEREQGALQDWKRMAAHLRYFEDHQEWRSLGTHRPVAVVEDAESGALVSGGLVDMIAVKHNPVRVVPRARLSDDTLRGARLVLNLETSLLDARQKEVLDRFTGGGGMMLTSPPEVKLPALREEDITLADSDLKDIDYLWRGINQVISQQNLGVRLFHASGMLSYLLSDGDGKRLVLHLVNYTNYPVENVTVRFPDQYASVRLLTPEGAPKKLETYAMDRGTAVDIDEVPVCATLIVE